MQLPAEPAGSTEDTPPCLAPQSKWGRLGLFTQPRSFQVGEGRGAWSARWFRRASMLSSGKSTQLLRFPRPPPPDRVPPALLALTPGMAPPAVSGSVAVRSRRLKITLGRGVGSGCSDTQARSEGYLAGPGPRNQGRIGGRGQRGRFHQETLSNDRQGSNQSPEPRAPGAPSEGPSDFARRGL